MYILCIESSNSRGMGHLFRALLYVEYFKSHNIDFMLLINNDLNSLKILESKKIEYVIVDFADTESNWEKDIIEHNAVNVWINDKFETSWEMGKHISDTKILFCLIDDVGKGEVFADIHFVGMIYPTRKDIKGKYVFFGNEYIILNPEIAQYRRIRSEMKKIVVSLGGSDPHGVTIEVVKALMQHSYDVTVIIGPNFKFKKELDALNKGHFPVCQNVPSLIETFYEYDLAITGGGVTCCEANAAGLPCVIVANAPHEENTGRYMESLGGCVYAGSHENWNRKILGSLQELDIHKMSLCGLNNFYLDTVERIMKKIEEIRRSN